MSSPRSGRFGLIVLEKVLEGAVAGGVVGGVVCQQRQMTPDPGSGEDADGVGVVVASVAGSLVELGGPGVRVPGVAGEVAEGVAEFLVGAEPEADAAGLPGLPGRGCDAGEARESAVGNLPRASPISASNRAARTVPERGRLVTTARSGCTRSCSAIRSARVWIWLARVRSTAT